MNYEPLGKSIPNKKVVFEFSSNRTYLLDVDAYDKRHKGFGEGGLIGPVAYISKAPSNARGWPMAFAPARERV